MAGLKFRRQAVIGPFIADFYCAEAKLVIEVDGDIHDAQADYDQNRSFQLEDYGYHVLRFRNSRIVNELDKVLLEITEKAFIPDPSPEAGRSALTPDPSPEAGRGERAGDEGKAEIPLPRPGNQALTPSPSPEAGRGERAGDEGITQPSSRAGRGERAGGDEGCFSKPL